MSLIHKQEMTEENLAAKRSNGSMTRGPLTPEGKANSAAANLRHGFYCKAQNGAIPALGEDPQEYADLMNSLEANVAEALESQLVQLIGDAVWRMKRAQRIKNGQALKRIQAAKEIHDHTFQPQRLRLHENLTHYETLVAAMIRRGNSPTAAEIHTFIKNFSDDPSDEMKEFFILLKSLINMPEGPERKAVRRRGRAQLRELEESYQRTCVRMADQFDEMESPESFAAAVAPQDEKSLLMQRMEDSNLRQLWRLTNVLFRVRNGELTPRDVKNEDRSDYVYENKGDDDKMSCDGAGSLQENTPSE